MAFEQLKIPILSSINDVPSTDVDLEHPKGSFFTEKYNLVLDTLSNRETITTYSFTLDTAETAPDNLYTFNDPAVLLSYLNNTKLQSYSNEFGFEIQINLNSDCDFGNFNLDNWAYVLQTYGKVEIHIKKKNFAPSTPNISFDSFFSPFYISFRDVNIKYGNFNDSVLEFRNCEFLYENDEISFNNCSILFSSTNIIYNSDPLKKIVLKNSNLSQIQSNFSFRLDAENSTIKYFTGTNTAITRAVIDARGCSIYLDNLRVGYLDITATNSNIHFEDCQILVDPGVETTKSFDIILDNCQASFQNCTLVDDSLSKLELKGSQVFYLSTSFATENLTNIHLEAKCSMIISKRNPANLTGTTIETFGILPPVESVIIYEDGTLLSR